jgi:hypothetical protein
VNPILSRSLDALHHVVPSPCRGDAAGVLPSEQDCNQEASDLLLVGGTPTIHVLVPACHIPVTSRRESRDRQCKGPVTSKEIKGKVYCTCGTQTSFGCGTAVAAWHVDAIPTVHQ